MGRAVLGLLLGGLVSSELSFGPPVRGSGVDGEYGPVIGTDGTDFLVSWHEHRVHPHLGVVWATMVAGDAGTARNVDGTRLSETYGDPGPTEIVFDGTNYVLAYTNFYSEVRMVRVDRSGALLDPAAFLLGPGTDARIAVDGNTLMVAYEHRNNDLQVARVTTNPSWDASVPVVLSTGVGTNGEARRPDIAFDGLGYLVVYNVEDAGATDVWARHLDRQGQPTGTPISIAAGPNFQREAHVAWGGGTYLVAWDDTANAPADVNMRLVSTGGVPGPVVRLAGGAWSEQHVALSFNGTDFFAAWEDGRSGAEVYGTRVTPAAAALDDGGVPLVVAGGSQLLPRLAFGAGGWLMTWQDNRYGGPNAYAGRVSSTGQPLDGLSGTLLQSTSDSQQAAALSSDGRGWLMVWEHHLPGSRELQGASLLVDGGAGAPMTLGTSVYEPHVASDGTRYLAVWDDGTDVRARHFDLAGAPLDAAFVVCNAAAQQRSAVVTWAGTDFAVVWLDARGGAGASQIYAAHVSATTTTVTPPNGFSVAPVTAPGDPRPRVAAVGTTVLATWSDRPTPTGGQHFIAYVRFTGTTVADTVPGQLALGGSPYDDSSDVASNGSEFMLVFHSYSSSAGDVYASRIGVTGAPLAAPARVVAGTGNDAYPAITWDGQRYLLAWEDYSGVDSDVVARWLEPDGGPSGMPFTVVATAEEDIAPAVSAVSTGRVAVGYSRFDAVIGTLRVGVKQVTELAAASGCGADAECKSGACVSGVCCASPCSGGCQVCSMAAGSSADGQCTTLPATTLCRAALSSCDVEERCTGGPLCPTDVTILDGQPCSGGRCAAGLCAAPPAFVSTGDLQARCFSAFHFEPTVTGSGPFTFSAPELPDGMTLDPMTGALDWASPRAPPSDVTVTLTATGPGGSASEVVAVKVSCAPLTLRAACGCGLGDASVVALWVAWLVRRRRSRPR